jgi:hypothetical protein
MVMAKVKEDAFTRGFSGMVGRMLVFRRVGNETIVSAAPAYSSSKRSSAAQQRTRKRFEEASRYASQQVADPVLKAAYTLSVKDKKGRAAYHAALADFLNPPAILRIDCTGYTGKPGNTIRVCATDDFRVVSVKVEVLDADGRVMESGIATQQTNGLEWIYITGITNPLAVKSRIRAVARDLPGNEVSREAEEIRNESPEANGEAGEGRD